MRPSLHGDCKVRVLKKRKKSPVAIPISKYSPKFFLENSFDRMFSRQDTLQMERRKDVLYRISSGEHSLSGSEELLVAGLYDSSKAYRQIPKPYITVSLNISDVASRRRLKIKLVYEGDESISSLGLKSLFPKQKGYRDERSKSYYFIWEVEEFLSKVNERVRNIPIIAGIDRVWVGENVRKGTEFESFEFVPVLPIGPLVDFHDSSTLKYIVRGGSRFGGPTLHKIDEISDDEAILDFYFPEPQRQSRYSKSPSRSCFTANGFLVFHEINGCDYYEPGFIFSRLKRENAKDGKG